MSQLFMVGGGCRSGKSKFALELADSLAGPKIFLATAEVAEDDEMRERIHRHQLERGNQWSTWEEAIELANRINAAEQPSVFLIDCMTLWVSQMMFADYSNAEILDATAALIESLRAGKHHAVIVTNEVGMGLVPEHPLGRKFRDIMGWVHQALAKEMDEVYFTAFGISLPMKRLEKICNHDRRSYGNHDG